MARVLWQYLTMPGVTREATAMLAILVATAVVQPRAFAAEPLPGGEATRAEIQIGLCAPAEKIEKALDLRPRGAPIAVWQFDDAALTLSQRGLRLRLRVTSDGRSEFTLKVAVQDCARFDSRLVPPGEGKCEYDVYGASTAGAVSLTASLGARSTGELLAGSVTPSQVLRPTQIRYLRDVVGLWPLPSGIQKIGPMQVRTYRTRDKLYDIDMSQLPAGEQYAEISRKVPLADAARAMAVMEADLSRAGIEACADQASQAANKLRSLLR